MVIVVYWVCSNFSTWFTGIGLFLRTPNGLSFLKHYVYFFSFIYYFVGVVIQQEVVRRNLC